uniref:Uncharacterized protein n=1 Tax=Fagus sylvatica TaxID=28930 RepID=A0A2N9FKN8_FAGSY
MAINEPWRPCFEELTKTEKKTMPSSEETPQLELKPLPSFFKYAYLVPVYGKLRTRCDDPYIVKEVFDRGAMVIEDPRNGRILKVNGQRLRPYMGRVVPVEEIMSLELDTYKDAS